MAADGTLKKLSLASTGNNTHTAKERPLVALLLQCASYLVVVAAQHSKTNHTTRQQLKAIDRTNDKDSIYFPFEWSDKN